MEECCGNCKYFYPVNGHPWVNSKPITEKAFDVCTLFSDVAPGHDERGKGRFILAKAEGGCEMFTPSKEIEFFKLKAIVLETVKEHQPINTEDIRNILLKETAITWLETRDLILELISEHKTKYNSSWLVVLSED